MAPNDIYIDEVYIDTNGGSAYTSIVNLLNGQSVHSSVNTTTGFKWIAQITNGTDSTIDMSNTTIRLNICHNYANDENDVSEHDTHIDITSGTIVADASYYIGWNSITGRTANTASTAYLADQKNDSNNIVAAARFKLYLNNVFKDVAGTNTQDGTNNYFTNSLSFHIFGLTSNDDGSLRRKLSVTPPNTSYTASDWQISTTNHLSSSAAGDPHITTFSGDHYEFDYLGAFRLFETQIDNNLIIINGFSEKGPGRWSNKQYIKKLFIIHNNKNILFDMGYRGSPVKVIENNGFTYTDEEIFMNEEAKRYSFDSRYSTINKDEPVTENLPELIRNEIKLTISDNDIHLFDIILQNVNEYNLQPCRINFNLRNRITKLAKGCLVDIRYAPVSKLDDIKSVKRLEEPTLLDLQSLPELEIEPSLRNIKWK